MTITNELRPANGWRAIVFSHGCIGPLEYRTNERYAAQLNAMARNGYMVFKSDVRGHRHSEGVAKQHTVAFFDRTIDRGE
jgi:hypothetical protein